ncbi:hypothetical protein [Glutamicibacter ardleyensis]|uniref:hypothetical protein n=1 Tax=Glutamicibacter ardleyensis TaxID=225894 RepID=UPI003FD0E95E
MATTPAAQTPAVKADDFDRKEITRLFARVKDEMGGLIHDAGRARPFYAPTKEKAVAKREAAVKALQHLADQIDALKKEDN